MSARNYINKLMINTPEQEMHNMNREEHPTRSSFKSWEGRGMCFIAIPKHVGHAIAAFFVYTALAIHSLAKKILNKIDPSKKRPDGDFLRYLSLAFFTPLCQVSKAFVAAAGVIAPSAYYTTVTSKSRAPSNFQINHFKGELYIQCPPKVLEEKPLEVLEHLTNKLKKDPNIQGLKVSLEGEQGTDRGGVSRDFVYQLMNNVSKELKIEADGIDSNADVAPALRNIGILLKFLSTNSQDLGIDEALPFSFYEAILSFTPDELMQSSDQLPLQTVFEILMKTSTGDTKTYLDMVDTFLNKDNSDANLNALADYGRTIMSFDIPEKVYSTANEEDFKTIMGFHITYINEAFRKRIQGFQDIAGGLFSSPQQWNHLRGLGAIELSKKVGGNFNPQQLFDALNFVNIGEPQKAAFLDRLKSKTPEQQKNFVIFTCGGPVIPAKLTIQGHTETNAATCTKTLYLLQDPNDADFSGMISILDYVCSHRRLPFDRA